MKDLSGRPSCLVAWGATVAACLLLGASPAHAQISGAYFPTQLSADEILLSMQFGTRMRYRPS